MPSSPLWVALRNKSTVPVGMADFLGRRSSSAISLASMALSSAVSADPPRPRICYRKVCRYTSWSTLCRARLEHMTWSMSVRAPLALSRGIASSTKPRAQRRCTLHEQDKCTKAVSSTNPWQKVAYSSPSSTVLCGADGPPPSPPSRRCSRTTAVASTITSSLCYRSALLSASPTVTIALHAGQRTLAAALRGRRRNTAGRVGEASYGDGLSGPPRPRSMRINLQGALLEASGVGDAVRGGTGGGSGVDTDPELLPSRAPPGHHR